MKEIWTKIAETGLARVYGIIVALGTFSITARWLGPEGRGIVTSALTWSALFCYTSCLSLGQVAIHHSTGKQDSDLLRQNVSALAAATFVLTILGWLFAASLYILSGGSAYAPLTSSVLTVAFLSLPFKILFQYFSWLIVGEGAISVNNFASVVSKTLSILLLFFAWHLGFGIEAALFILVISDLSISIVQSRFLGRRIGWRFDFQLLRLQELVKGGIKLHPSSIGNYLVMSTNILVVTSLSGAENAGYYQLAWQLVTMSLIISEASSSVLFGTATSLGPKAAWPIQKKTLKGTTLLVLGGVIVGLMIAPQLVLLLGGVKFAASINMFRWLLPTLLILNFTTVMQPQWITRGLFVHWSATLVLAGIINIGLSFLLVPSYQSYGAVIANLVSAVILLIPNLWLFSVNEREAAADHI